MLGAHYFLPQRISLDREYTNCHHWLYDAQEINLISDCPGLLGRLNKDLCEIQNKRLQKIMQRIQLYNFTPKHISGDSNKVCDALSRLCRTVSGYSRYYPNRPRRLLELSKKPAKHLETFDPLCQEMAEEGSLDNEYLEIMAAIKNEIETKDLSDPSELRKLGKFHAETAPHKLRHLSESAQDSLIILKID